MLSLTVEAADDLLANSRLFRRISGFHHAFGQAREFVSGQLSLCVQLVRKPDHAQLLFGIEAFDFLDDLTCGHTQILFRTLPRFNVLTLRRFTIRRFNGSLARQSLSDGGTRRHPQFPEAAGNRPSGSDSPRSVIEIGNFVPHLADIVAYQSRHPISLKLRETHNG